MVLKSSGFVTPASKKLLLHDFNISKYVEQILLFTISADMSILYSVF